MSLRSTCGMSQGERERKGKRRGEEEEGTEKNTENGHLPDTLKDFRRKHLPAP